MWMRAVLFGVPMLALVVWLHVFLYRRLLRPLRQRWLRVGLLVFAIAAALVTTSLRFLGPVLGNAVALALLAWGGFLLYTFMLMLPAIRFRPERRALFEKGAVVAAAGFTGYGTYRALTPPEITETVIRLPKLPKTLEGVSIVQLTDIHIGPVIQAAFLRDLVARANALKPDLCVITGDLVDGRVAALGHFTRELGRLEARWGRHFVTGNHDYYSGADAWCAFLEQLGFNVLRNRSQLLPEGIRLIGVDDHSARRFGEGGYDLELACRDAHLADEPSILLAHQPAGFDDAVDQGIGLQISGHTHGGQLFPATLGAYAIWQGRSRGLTREKGASLYVSRGCGFVGPPMRIGSPPEIAKIILTSG